jgi:PAS domain S-box-containing protein
MTSETHEVSPESPGLPVLRTGEIALTPDPSPAQDGQNGEAAVQETRIGQAEARTERAEIRVEQAKSRIEQAEARTEQAETRTEQAKTRTEQAETRTELAETRSEQEIHAAQLDYRRIFKAAKDGILILDAETGEITDANPALIGLLGLSRPELIETPIWELGAFRDVLSNKTKFEQVQAHGYRNSEHLKLETREGQKFSGEFVSNVYRAGDRNVVQCNVRDASGPRRAQETSVRLAAIVNSSEDAIIGKTLDGIITSWNPGAEKVFGYSADEAVGQSMVFLFPPDRVDEETEILARIKRGESIKHFETVRLGKNGKQIDVSVSLSRIVDADNKTIGLSKIARDITLWKQAEKEVRRLNTELEQRVEERTAQLEAANQELECFSYSVSHDLRAPLRAIDGFSQVLQDDFGPELPQEAQRYLKTIREGAQQMGTLIDGLLKFSRLSRFPLTRGTVDTNELVRLLAVEMNQPGDNGVAEMAISDLPESNADPVLLRQVWINLLSNALKYSRHRKPARIEIGAAEYDGLTTWFIKDNGTGFDMQYVDKLFGVFQRLHRVEDFEGTGVGLAIVQRIIQRHGGRIWADAAVDEGATFFFTLGNNLQS